MIGIVFRKELRDHWRDRRSLLGALILPMIGPVLLLLVFNLITERTKERPLEVPVVGAEHAPALIAFLESQGAKIDKPPADPEAAVISGDVPMVLEIDADYARLLAESRPAPLSVLVDNSNQNASRSVDLLQRLLAGYGEQIATQRLILRGVTPSITKPIRVRERNLASPQRAAAQILNIIPLLLVLVAFVGGMNIAIDATAGERERGSLEPLLLNPVARRDLVLGKWLATCVFATAVLLLAATGFVVTVTVFPPVELGLKVDFGPSAAALAVAALIPLVLLAAALQMIVATFARTFKEAQTYLSLFTLLPIAPALYLMFESTAAQTWMMLLPAMGQIAVINDVLRGDAVSAGHIALLWGTAVIYTVLCLGALTRLLQRETIVYGR